MQIMGLENAKRGVEKEKERAVESKYSELK